MKRLPKLLLALAVPALVTGGIVSFSGIQFAPQWTVALPVGVILLGLFLISWLMQDEVARFDAEERAKNESALRDQVSRHGPPSKRLTGGHRSPAIHTIANVLKKSRQTMVWAALIIAITAGCNNRETTASPPRATGNLTPDRSGAKQASAVQPVLFAASQPSGNVTQSTVDMVSIPADSPRSQFIASMDAELKTIGADIYLLSQRVDNIEPNARIQAQYDLAVLRQKYVYTSEQLQSLKATTGAAWDNAKASFGHVMQNLSDACEDVNAEFIQDGVM